MFRIRSYLFNIRCLLQRHQPTDRYVASLHQYTPSQYKVQVRETCPQKPPPPPPKPKDDSAFWGAMAVLFLAGGFVVIAKRSPEIRDWLIIHAPWFDDLIAIAYEENLTYGEFAQKCVNDAKNYFKTLKKGDEPTPCSLDVESKPVIKSIESEPPCEETSSIVSKTVCEIVERLEDRGEEALSNYYTVITACTLYNQIVTDTMHHFSMPKLKELHDHMAERLNLISEHIPQAEEATAAIESLTRYLECGVIGPKEDIESAKQLMSDYLQKIKASVIQYQWENAKSVALDSQWQKVESLVNKYYKENETMFSELKYEENNLQVSGDMDLMLYHTSRYSQQLKAQLNDIAASMTDRVDRAYATVPKPAGEKEKKQWEATILSVIKEKKAEMDKEFQKRYNDQNLANDKRLKDSLKNQLERHQETLETRLAQKEKETTKKLDELVAENVAYEKGMFKKQLEEMAVKLKVVEDKLNARLKAERDQKLSQELWIAGASLLAATKKGEPYVKVDKELKAIEKASGGGDKLVDTVLKAIPESVKEKGLVPESVLRERYHKMEATALKVALVEQEGAPLPIYFISWLQSTLLFMKLSGIPQQEIDKPPQEPFEDLDTFDLLQRARFWIERGNLAVAIRYVSYLEGASRAAAATWYDAARSHVETRQAAEAILAHAAALGLQYI